MSYETDGLKRDLERLSLEFHHLRGDQGRDREKVSEAVQSLAEVQAQIDELTRRADSLEQRLAAIEEAMPSSSAELLALASTRVAGLLGVLAHDEATTVAKLQAIVEKLPSRTITTNGSPYLTRWYLWPEGPRTVEDADLERRENDPGSDLPFAVFLHKFHRGDMDRDLHSHPWSLSISIILAGGYREERETGIREFLPGSINVIRSDDFHRVDLINPATGSWSLFIAGTRTNGWGFKLRDSGEFVDWKTYTTK